MQTWFSLGVMRTGSFFSDGSCSTSDRSEDDMALEEYSLEGTHESSSQPEQQTLVSYVTCLMGTRIIGNV